VSFGVFSIPGRPPRVGWRRGDRVLDLAMVDDVFAAPSLKPFMARGPAAWQAALDRISDSADSGIPLDEVTLNLPFEVADYVDFYSSIEHATNVGRLFRPDAPLLPNWRHVPIGYHGRSGTVVVSGTDVVRPCGQSLPSAADAPGFGPSTRLDVELELGFVVGVPSRLGQPVPPTAFPDHVFGVVLVNDWSARDIQAWEYQPLGPFLGKSFATSISAWVTPLATLEHARVHGPAQEPKPLPYLRHDDPWNLDLDLEIELNGAVVSRTNSRSLYWSFAQQLAHLTSNGASIRTGDLCASGTVSGATPGSEGSLLELTRGGREAIELGEGTTRTFLEDGDDVVLRGRTGDVELGEVRGRILPALCA
jgi:fumarylacetoacetase